MLWVIATASPTYCGLKYTPCAVLLGREAPPFPCLAVSTEFPFSTCAVGGGWVGHTQTATYQGYISQTVLQIGEADVKRRR